jgi:hypothetical protein
MVQLLEMVLFAVIPHPVALSLHGAMVPLSSAAIRPS